MTISKKQLKITKLFKRTATKLQREPQDGSEELLVEVQQLQQKLRHKQNELFQIQRNMNRENVAPPKKTESDFVKPKKIILQNSIESLEKNLEFLSMLTGFEVQSFEAGDHCSVVFHMHHLSQHAVSHGLRIELDSGSNNVSSCSLPLGFNLSAILEEYDNIMKPECLGAIRKALVAYYNRLQQFNALKKLLNIEAELFKTLDGTHMEIAFFVQSEEDEDPLPLTVMLDYRIYDIRPKNYAIKELDLPEGAADGIKEQCAIFKKKPLRRAFKEAFVKDVQYKMVQQLGPRPAEKVVQPKRFPRNKHNYNDDTFLPEECSDQGEDDEE